MHLIIGKYRNMRATQLMFGIDRTFRMYLVCNLSQLRIPGRIFGMCYAIHESHE